jgi:hypothetical protein
MREFDALQGYPKPATPRRVSERRVANRIIASYRDREFFDGERANGYAGLKNDGRWAPIAAFMAKEYGLQPGSEVLQIQAEKGFLLAEFAKLGMHARGTETSQYAIHNGSNHIGKPGEGLAYVEPGEPREIHWGDGFFDLVIAIGPVYVQTLPDAIRCLREVERVKKQGGHSFITLGAYEDREDYWLMRSWSLLGETLLRPSEWVEVLQHAGYSGDYKFVTAKTLGLQWT